MNHEEWKGVGEWVTSFQLTYIVQLLISAIYINMESY